jgi:hypothetical protein
MVPGLPVAERVVLKRRETRSGPVRTVISRTKRRMRKGMPMPNFALEDSV